MSEAKIVFHLAKYFPPRTMKPCDMHDPRTLYQRIKDGSKTSEYRDNYRYWLKRLCHQKALDKKVGISTEETCPIDITNFLKVHNAWFVEGYPKGCLPRLEADITKLILHPLDMQLEICITNVKEVLSPLMAYAQKQNEEVGKILNTHRTREAAFLFTTPKGVPEDIEKTYRQKRKDVAWWALGQLMNMEC